MYRMGNQGFIRTAALWSAAGSALGAAIGIMAGLVPLIHEDTPAVTIPRELVLASFHMMLLFGLLALWRSGVAGNSALAKIGFGLAVVSRAIFAVAELMVILDLNMANMIFGIATPLQGLGMIGIGVAVLTTMRWKGWHTLVPLLCGLYTFVVLLPAFVLSGGPNYYVIGGWSICYLLLSLALYQEADQTLQAQLSTAG